MQTASRILASCLRGLGLTNRRLVLVLVGVVWTLLACTPTVYVEKPTSMSLLETARVDAMLGAHASAHNVAGMVRGDKPSNNVGYLEPMHLPEAYTLDGSEGTTAAQFDVAYAAARLIRTYYGDAYPHAFHSKSDKFVDIADAVGGNTDDIYEPNKKWPIEIADEHRRMVFELVPPGETHQAYGKKKADLHAMLLNGTLFNKPQFKLGTGFSGEMGVRFEEGSAPWKLSFKTVEPGVVAFKWQAMTVAKATEESTRRAYLDKSWHDVTPHEIERHGRLLHIVVEKLLQAREAMNPTRAVIKMPLVPGKTLFDYLQTVADWSAHDEQRAQLLPVQYGPPVEVVPKKQFVAETNGEDDDEAEGLFDLKGKPGRQPDNLHMGNSAHRLIGKRYELLHPKDTVFVNWTNMSTIVREVLRQPLALKRNEALLRPDIVNVNDKIMFEIKSSALGRMAEGQVAVNKYLATLNQFLAPAEKFNPGLGFSGNFWVRFDLNMPWWRIEWDTTVFGVVQYKWKRLNSDELDEPTIVRGLESGKYTWVDLTEGEIRPLAQECAKFAKAYADGSEKLYKVQMVSSFVIESIGHAAVVYLNAGLGTKSNTVPKAAAPSTQTVPNVGTNRVRVGAEPTPTTRVPAGQASEPIPEPEFEPNVANRMRR